MASIINTQVINSIEGDTLPEFIIKVITYFNIQIINAIFIKDENTLVNDEDKAILDNVYRKEGGEEYNKEEELDLPILPPLATLKIRLRLRPIPVYMLILTLILAVHPSSILRLRFLELILYWGVMQYVEGSVRPIIEVRLKARPALPTLSTPIRRGVV